MVLVRQPSAPSPAAAATHTLPQRQYNFFLPRVKSHYQEGPQQHQQQQPPRHRSHHGQRAPMFFQNVSLATNVPHTSSSHRMVYRIQRSRTASTLGNHRGSADDLLYHSSASNKLDARRTSSADLLKVSTYSATNIDAQHQLPPQDGAGVSILPDGEIPLVTEAVEPQEADITALAAHPPPPLPGSGAAAPPSSAGRLSESERVELLRISPLFKLLSEPVLQGLAGVATEKECGRFHTVRPTTSLLVLVSGGVLYQPTSKLALTGPMPHELFSTAPDPETATAAHAIALDATVAGEAVERGATVGLHNLVAGLVAAPPSFLCSQPSHLLQLPLAEVQRALTPAVAAAVATEARLRMLLALRSLKTYSAPVPRLRALAALTITQEAPPEALIFSAGTPPDATLLLVHGRVDLVDEGGKLYATIDETAAPPLGELPAAAAATATAVIAPPPRAQSYSAVAAERCLLLRGGLAAAEALTTLLAPGARRQKLASRS